MTEDPPPEPPVTDVIIQENNLPPLPTPTDPNNTCGSVVTFGSIVGGHDAKRGAYPFIAALGIKNIKKNIDLPIIYVCGGSLIHRRYVVTAGVNPIYIFFVIDSLLRTLDLINSLLVRMEQDEKRIFPSPLV
jgi:hypothetical protein